MREPTEVARLSIGTSAGEFELRAFEGDSGFVHVALVKGDIADGRAVLTRIHSECVTGDALGSLRCDCGPQLRAALRAVAAEGRGVVLYVTGHEGRGIGLVNKLKAYMLQEGGADTCSANVMLGLPADGRSYREAAACLALLGIRSVRLLTNNPSKEVGLVAAGIAVDERIPLPTSAHVRNVGYLRAKQHRLGHIAPTGAALSDGIGEVVDVSPLVGAVRLPDRRPYVLLKYAQTLDGRIATRTGDARWISGEAERRVSHALRASCDAVLVGVGTVVADDPQLTVRMLPGTSPLRVVLDSTLRLPDGARLLGDDAPTAIVTTRRSSEERRRRLRARGVVVHVAEAGVNGVDLASALVALRAGGIKSLLVEGGARVITSFLAGRLADRIVVGIAPSIIGAGTEAVGDLRVARVRDGLRVENQSVFRAGDDLLVAGDLAPGASALAARRRSGQERSSSSPAPSPSAPS